MMEEASAFAPCHITGIFQICDAGQNILDIGSKGAGVSLNTGARTTVTATESSEETLSIKINGQTARVASVSTEVVALFRRKLSRSPKLAINVDHDIEAPIGAGFGASGAMALSLCLALNKALNLGMPKVEAAQMAHIAEVECKTGLEIRTAPGAPGIGKVVSMPVPAGAIVICQAFGPLSTKKFLTDEFTRNRINEIGGKLVHELVMKPSVNNFMSLSRRFAEHVGLISEKVRGVLNATDKKGIICSMPMFGECAFTISNEKNAKNILQIFQEFGPTGKSITSTINQQGAKLLS
jgi:pantoate kinase